MGHRCNDNIRALLETIMANDIAPTEPAQAASTHPHPAPLMLTIPPCATVVVVQAQAGELVIRYTGAAPAPGKTDT